MGFNVVACKGDLVVLFWLVPLVFFYLLMGGVPMINFLKKWFFSRAERELLAEMAVMAVQQLREGTVSIINLPGLSYNNMVLFRDRFLPLLRRHYSSRTGVILTNSFDRVEVIGGGIDGENN